MLAPSGSRHLSIIAALLIHGCRTRAPLFPDCHLLFLAFATLPRPSVPHNLSSIPSGRPS
jgi:hypothetical protein